MIENRFDILGYSDIFKTLVLKMSTNVLIIPSQYIRTVRVICTCTISSTWQLKVSEGRMRNENTNNN